MIFITGNKFKQQEISEIIPNIDFSNIDLKEIFSIDNKEIVKFKLFEAYKKIKRDDILVEDVIMKVNDIVYPDIKWKINELKQNDKVTMIHTLGHMKNNKIYFYIEKIDGIIDLTKEKKFDFGFDNIFIVNGLQYGEAKKDDKYNIRKKNLIKFLEQKYDDKIKFDKIEEWNGKFQNDFS
jgi:inosine/xanthosine triphosphate pyrophosphatase family protein